MRRLWRFALAHKLPLTVELDKAWTDSQPQRAAIRAILLNKTVVYNAWIEDGNLDTDRMPEGSVIVNTTVVHNKVIAETELDEIFPHWLMNPCPN